MSASRSRFQPAGFFALRAPLLPFGILAEWAADLAAPAAVSRPNDLASALGNDRARIRAAYRRLLDDPVIREALFVASPDLDSAVDRWCMNPDGEHAVERALTRYLTRFASRATPFGLFASTALGFVSQQTALLVPTREACRRRTRLDIDYLVRLAEALQKVSAISAALGYRPNDSLRRSADRWRYIETRVRDRLRSYHLVALEPGQALDATIARARDGATRAALAAALVDQEVAIEEAEAYVDELIDNQVLVSDLVCPVTGPEPLGVLEAQLRTHPAGTALADALASVSLLLQALDNAPPGAPRDAYRAVARTLESLPASVDPARLFQVDVFRPSAGTLGQDVIAEIERGVALLHRLQPPARTSELDRFRAAFAECYGEREVPLDEALDEDVGVGQALGHGHRDASPLLEGLDLPDPPRRTIEWGAREDWLMDRVGRALAAGADEVELSEGDVDALAMPEPLPLPDAFAAMATVVATSGSQDGAGGYRVWLQHVAGPSGATLLGRFCHGDAELHARVLQHLRDEEALDPEAIYAEIVHLPEGRVGNVLLRPALRAFEIPYLGRSGASPDRQIPVGDLMVSLHEGRFVLRSRRLGKRIVPRLSSAHNFLAGTVGVYRFLCLLQSDGRMGACAWQWGPLASLPFLPRISVGRLVLSKATWRVTKADMSALTAADAVDGYEAVQRWRGARRLPRWAVLTDDDNMLPIDLDNVLAVESFVHLLRRRDGATLTELFPGPDELCATGPEGRFVHEVVVPFTIRAAATVPAARVPAVAPATREPEAARRVFPPGSSWVFTKVYASSTVADRLLLDTVAPVSRALMEQGAVDRWFFIRHQDPEWHLRWRLHVDERASPGDVRGSIEAAMAPLVAAGLVRRFAFDTYEREIERYGGPGAIALAERWFWADSEAVVDIIEAVGTGDGGADVRWRAAVAGVDRLLDDFGLGLEARSVSMRTLREGFGREFRADASLRRQLARKFRGVYDELSGLLLEGVPAGQPIGDAVAAVALRSERSRAVMAGLRRMDQKRLLQQTIPALAESCVHMHLNRLFRCDNRLHEFVICDLLAELYGRRANRLKRPVNPPPPR